MSGRLPARLLCLLACLLSGANAAECGQELFSEDFETDLSQWVGKGGGPHHGTIVDDPLRPGNHVLTFTDMTSFGDVFSDAVHVSPEATYILAFDYLGIFDPHSGAVEGDLGGFIGFAEDTPGKCRWLAGTGMHGGAEDDPLLDDGQWHTHALLFNPFVDGSGEPWEISSDAIRVMIEDYSWSGGTAGDVFFDNVRLVMAGLETGLVAYYPFDGNARDASGNGNHGTVEGAALTSDRFGRADDAYVFDGRDECIRVSSSDALNIRSQITIACWAYVVSYYHTLDDWAPLVCKGHTSSMDSPYALTIRAGRVELVLNRYHQWGGLVVPTEEWVHVAATWDGRRVRYYVNGVQDPQVNHYTGLLNVRDEDLLIGCDPPGLVEWLDGKLDDVFVYDRALSISEIRELYQTGGPDVELSDVTAHQRTSGTGIVDIQYSLSLDDLDSAEVTLGLSSDGGLSFPLHPVSLSGDVGPAIEAGSAHRIEWDCLVDMPGVHGDNFVMMLTASAGGVSSSAISNVFTIDTRPPATVGYLKGIVFDRITGEPLAGATVAADDVGTTSGEDGHYLLLDLEPRMRDLTVTMDGYMEAKASVRVEEGHVTEHDVSLIPAFPGEAPVVLEVTSAYCDSGRAAYFLDGVGVEVAFTADVFWRDDTPGEIEFRTPFGGAVAGPEATRTFDVGYDFGTEGKLVVVARSEDGDESPPYEANFEVVGTPLAGLVMAAVPEKEAVLYRGDLPLAFEGLGVPSDAVSGDIPLFGGKDVKYGPYVLKPIEYRSTGVASWGVSADGGEVKVAMFMLKPKVEANVNWQYDGYLGWGADGRVSVFCDFEAQTQPFYFAVVAGVPIYARAAFSAHSAAHLDIEAWQEEDAPDLNGIVEFCPIVTGILGAGVADVLSVEGKLGAGVELTASYPDEPHLRELTLVLVAHAKVTAFLFQYEQQLYRGTWDLLQHRGTPAPPARILVGHSPDWGEFQLMPRDYLKSQEGVAQAKRAASRKLFGVKSGSDVSEQVVEPNAFPHADPQVARAGDSELLCWLSDEASRSDINRTVLVHALVDEEGVSAPTPIEDDGTPDFHPCLAAVDGSDVLAAWSDASEPVPDGASLEEACQFMEITAARYSESKGTWEGLITLTDNGFLDRSPRIATSSSGEATLVWVANEASDPIGSKSRPNSVMYSMWDGVQWSEAAVASAGLRALTRLEVAFVDDGPVVLFCIDRDGDLATEDDQELYALAYGGTDWGKPSRLTRDHVQDTSPKLVTMGIEPTVIWYRGGNLVECSFSGFDASLAQEILPSEKSSTLLDFRLIPNDGGDIALIWAEGSESGSDIWKLVYDTSADVWGQRVQLTDDLQVERSLAGTYASTGDLLLAYNKVKVTLADETFDIDGQDVTVRDYPTFGQTDLCLLRERIAGDLAVATGSISLSKPNPQVGDTVKIRASIINKGDFAASDVTVGFYDGHPDRVGALIGLETIPGLIAPGESRKVRYASWTVTPLAGRHYVHVVVDPSEEEPDRDRSNNVAWVEANSPDLVGASVRAASKGPTQAIVRITAENVGSAPAEGFDVALTLRDSVGEQIETFRANELNVGQRKSWTYIWDFSEMVFGARTVSLHAVIDVRDEIPEFREENNAISTLVDVAARAVPAVPSGPTPADGATGVPITALLEWEASARATAYDAYLWEASSSKPETPTAADLTEPQFSPSGLRTCEQYVWQVVAKGELGETPGPEWQFGTVGAFDVSGTILCDGKGLKRAKLTINSEGLGRFKAKTNKRGEFRLRDVPCGVYDLEVKYSKLKVRKMARDVRVEVTVSGGAIPIADGMLKRKRTTYEAEMDDGQFIFEGVSPGKYRLTVSGDLDVDGATASRGR